jgi:peptide/nickel transport system substrate-binding protein
LTQEPDTLNPLLTQSPAAQAVDTAIFDGLLRVNSHNSLQPSLAATWSHSRDGKTWTFHLRRGVRWADGVPLTSADVAWTYQQIANPGNQVASTLGWDQVDRLTTPDPNTVIMHLRRVLAPWLLEVGTTAILPRHALVTAHNLGAAPFNRRPFGTGPYQVVSWTPGRRIVLTANPHSWPVHPRFTTLIFRFFPDDTHQLAALQAGSIQIGQINAGQAAYAARVGLRVIRAPSMTWYHVDLKQWGPLRDLAVRKALDYATPRDQILRDVASGFGQTAFADQAPSLTPYYDPSLRPRAYLPTRASAMLAGAGYHRDPTGFLTRCTTVKTARTCIPLAISLWYIQGDSFGAGINRLLVGAWTRLGVRVTLHQAPAAQLFGPTGPQFTHAATGITYAWTNGDDPDDRFYWNSASIPSYPTASGGNDVAYFHRFSFQTTIDALTNLGVSPMPTAARQTVYWRIQSLLLGQVPVIFLYWADQLWVAPPALRGFVPNPYTTFDWNIAAWR